MEPYQAFKKLYFMLRIMLFSVHKYYASGPLTANYNGTTSKVLAIDLAKLTIVQAGYNLSKLME